MDTPWERELAKQREHQESAYTEVKLSPVAAKALRKRPRTVFYTAILLAIGVTFALWILYVEVKFNLDNGTSGYTRRNYLYGRYDHSANAVLVVFLPLSLMASALSVRYLLMKKAAHEISAKIAKKLKCTSEFENAVYAMIVRTPWSAYRFNRFVKKNSKSGKLQVVTTDLGETRSLEFRDNFSTVVIGPQRWSGIKRKTAWDEILEDAERYPY